MRRLLFLLIVVISSFNGNGQLLIRNTTIVDVENKKLVPRQSVFIKDGKINRISADSKAPAGTTIIDGQGKYLVPGWVDAHVHFFQSGGIYARPDAIDLRKYRPYEQEVQWVHENMEHFLRRYSSAGITTVIDVGSTISFLKQRDSFRTKSYAPTIYMTGPLLTTWEPPIYKGLKEEGPFFEMKTAEDARRYVQAQLPFKPDFIKIWFIVHENNKDSAARIYLPLVQAAIQEAHKNGLRVAVHATELITAQLAVEAGANFLVHDIFNEPVEEAFVQLLKSKSVVLSPTLIVASGYERAFGQRYQPTEDDLRYAHPAPVQSLAEFKKLPDTALLAKYRTAVENGAANAKARDALLRNNLKQLSDGGVLIATGTDAGNIGTQHVSSYFQELAAMQQAGLDMWQLLQASTINGAHAVGKEAEFGSIKEGKRADLLLLNQNPLDGINNWKNIDRVIIKGIAMTPKSLL